MNRVGEEVRYSKLENKSYNSKVSLMLSETAHATRKTMSKTREDRWHCEGEGVGGDRMRWERAVGGYCHHELEHTKFEHRHWAR